MSKTKWINGWKLLGAVIANVPTSAVYDEDGEIRCAITSCGAVRVDADGERCWYYRMVHIEHETAGSDPIYCTAGPKMYRTRGSYGMSSLKEVVGHINDRKRARHA